MTSPAQQQLQQAIQALEAQRGVLGDVVVKMAVAPLEAKLAALSAAPALPGEPGQALRHVSILFLDVVGSTTLAQHLDPEAISAVMDGALTRGTAVVQAHQGKVLQYAGDNILAAFGAHESREDDTERAVRCGLALLELGKLLGAEVESTHGYAGFNVRVGVHTGGVLLGGGIEADGSIRGIAVNIAARMEQTAPSGSLRISQDTYAQVRGLFDVDAQEPLTVKGVDAPILSFLVRRAKARHFRTGTRGIDGVATKMIGRDAELEQLQSAFKRLFEARQFAAITVVADAGIGKSRLLYEFEAWADGRRESFSVFRGRATPQTDSQTFGLLRDILAWRFQIQDDDSIEVARKKVEDGIVPLFLHDEGADQAQAHAHLLGHLIGIEWRDSRHIKAIFDDPKQIRNRAFHAAAQLFRRVAAVSGPVLLQLEDLHWADGESLDFLKYLTEVNRDVPLLVLSFTRPTLFERRQDWRSTEGMHQRIDLPPLDKRASRDLANELLKKLPDIPAALRELLTGSSEGNPFYMEELVKMLIDQGAIHAGSDDRDMWTVDAGRLLVTKVPATLTGVVQARLDGLPRPEKVALQQASIVGAVFWQEALEAIEGRAAEHLPALERRGLTQPRADASLDGMREYAFRHHVLHQVTYDTVLKHQKLEGHARVARWLATLSEQGRLRAGDFLGTAAEHFEQAGDESNAAEFHARAAEQANQRMAHERVLAHVARALSLLGRVHATQPVVTELRWRLLSVREKTLALLAQRDKQAADLDALMQLADVLGDDRRRSQVGSRRSVRAMRLADWSAAEGAAHDAMACATRAGDDVQRLDSLRMLAWAQVMRGNIDAGRALAQQGSTEASGLGLRHIKAMLLNVLGVGAELQGDLVNMLDVYGQALHLCRETGDQVAEAINLSNVGRAFMKLGDLSQAHRVIHEALLMLRSNGDRVMECVALSALSGLAHWRGDETDALALARQALDIAVAAKSRDYQVTAGLRLGEAELALGRTAAARDAFKGALAQAQNIGIPWQHDASVGLARVALSDVGAVATEAAIFALKPLLDHLGSGGTMDGILSPRQAELTCYQVLARFGDPRSADWLARAHGGLMAQADAISRSTDKTFMRQNFLTKIPHHREIEAEWAKRESVGNSPPRPVP